jgi:hypothetical protein
MGIEPGDKLEADMMPDDRATLRAARSMGKIDKFVGILTNKTRKFANLDEISEAAAEGWSSHK